LLNGVSLQRTGYLEVYNSSNRKIVVVNDGETFNDTMETLSSLSFVS
jgi:nitrate reductase NapAB chaperone NapD